MLHTLNKRPGHDIIEAEKKMELPLLSICMLGKFPCFCCHLLTSLKNIFSKCSLRNNIRVSKSLDPDLDQQNIDPDQSPNHARVQNIFSEGPKFDFFLVDDGRVSGSK